MTTMVDSNNIRILIADNEQSIRRFLQIALAAQGYIIFEATTGQEAINTVVNHRPDLVILETALPDLDGVAVMGLLRKWTQLPIIILSTNHQEQKKISALDAGADDYLTKPFSLNELLARIRVALRRHYSTGEAIFTSGELRVDFINRLIRMGNREVQLTPTEYDLLHLFVTHVGRVLTHQQLLQQIWGADYKDDLHMLRVNISNLRRKLEPEPARPRYIITEPGVGYRLRPVG
jgi:two-component system KDP operon response regulator KdpE